MISAVDLKFNYECDMYDQICVCEFVRKSGMLVLVSSSFEKLESPNSLIRVRHFDIVDIFR